MFHGSYNVYPAMMGRLFWSNNGKMSIYQNWKLHRWFDAGSKSFYQQRQPYNYRLKLECYFATLIIFTLAKSLTVYSYILVEVTIIMRFYLLKSMYLFFFKENYFENSYKFNLAENRGGKRIAFILSKTCIHCTTCFTKKNNVILNVRGKQ